LYYYTTYLEKKGECGWFHWDIQWLVSPLPTGDPSGQIVQKTDVSAIVVDCDNGSMRFAKDLYKDPPGTHFWEAFRVGTKGTYGDRWTTFPLDNTRGVITIRGQAAYYHGLALISPPWALDPPLRWYTKTTPSTGIRDSNYINRGAIMTWNCCCNSKDRKTHFIITPGEYGSP